MLQIDENEDEMEQDDRPIGLRKSPRNVISYDIPIISYDIKLGGSGNTSHSGGFWVHGGVLSGDQKWQMANYWSHSILSSITFESHLSHFSIWSLIKLHN